MMEKPRAHSPIRQTYRLGPQGNVDATLKAVRRGMASHSPPCPLFLMLCPQLLF